MKKTATVGILKATIAKWIGVDIAQYQKLKSENKKLKGKLSDIDKEMKLQISELKQPCRLTDQTMHESYPPETVLPQNAEDYNVAANTERIIYLQKIQYLTTMIER